MAETQIIREQTPEEQKDFTDIRFNKKNPTLVQIEKMEQEMNNTGKPFCRRCALMDLEDMKEKLIKESGRSVYEKTTALNDIRLPDISQYKNPTRFAKMGERKIKEKRLLNGSTQHIDIVFTDYRCKVRGCGVSIQQEGA